MIIVLMVAFQVPFKTTKIIFLVTNCWDPECRLQPFLKSWVAVPDLSYIDVCAVPPSFSG